MPKVHNKKTISMLSKKTFKSNKSRNIIATLAIILTTVMLTSLFTIGGTLIDLTQESNFRMVGTSSHGGFKYLTQKEYDTLKVHPDIKDISYSIPVSIADNKELSKLSAEIRFSEDNSAKWGYTYPEKGTMPIGYKDLATSTVVLDALGIPHELGQKIQLEFECRGKQYKETFDLVGIWEGDSISVAQQIFLSKEYINEICPTSDIPYYDQESPEFMGTINADVWLSNAINIDEQLIKIVTESGLSPDKINIGVNWGYYTSSDIDILTVIGMVIILLVIMFSGYMLIYNVFYISISKDIQYYGLLKTIGTTAKQIKQIVLKQALYLCIAAVPIGFILGYLISNIIVPYILQTLIFKGMSGVSLNIWIILFSCLFSVITVIISASNPAKLASKVSPIEAIRIADIGLSTKKKSTKTKKVSIFTMAYKNVFRNKKKLFFVVTSLLLSIVLVLSVYSSVISFDFDLYLSRSIRSDFIVTNPRLAKRYEANYIEPDSVDTLSNFDNIEDMGSIYFTEAIHKLSEIGIQNYPAIKQDMAEKISYFPVENDIPSHIYGIDPIMYDKLDFKDNEKFDDRFLSGDYVYLAPMITKDENSTLNFYSVGDKITLDFESGNSKEYTVLGIANLPQNYSIMHTHFIDVHVILPSEEYLSMSGEQNPPIHLVIDVDDTNVESVENELEEYCKTSGMYLSSKSLYVDEFNDMISMYIMVGGTLVFILGIIGILNFINSMLTSVITRKIEIATLQSVGMTSNQVRNMLIYEGLIHFALVIILSLTIGQGFVYLFTQIMAGQVWMFKYHFSLLPIVFCIPILLIICYIVPLIAYKNLNKQSIVERLRSTN